MNGLPLHQYLGISTSKSTTILRGTMDILSKRYLEKCYFSLLLVVSDTMVILIIHVFYHICQYFFSILENILDFPGKI